MGEVPFGFGARGEDEPERPDPAGSGDGPDSPPDPFAALFGGAGLPGMGMPAGGDVDLGAMLSQLGKVLSWSGGPVNWDLARDIARQFPAVGNDRLLGEAERTEVAEALRLAELWLDPVTTLPAGATRATAWSRAEWIEATLPAWRPLVEPVAARVSASLGETLAAQAPPEMSSLVGPLDSMMRTLGGAMFGAQVGQALGTLAEEVFGSTDVGLPLGPAGHAVLLPRNVAAFGEGLGVPADEVRLYLALREAACHRLYAHAGWLQTRVASDILRYAQEITIDTSRLEEAAAGLDPASLSDPDALQEALVGDLFSPAHTEAQRDLLLRLEGLLALIEGWIDEVVAAAAAPHLPGAAALREAVRRRRATGGPAEQTFASLVGLELRPRRLRDAVALWQAVLGSRGMSGRDAVWDHPDYLPRVEDLDDPGSFAASSAAVLDLSELETAPEAPPEDGVADGGIPGGPQ
jgi:putative hydrolase